MLSQLMMVYLLAKKNPRWGKVHFYKKLCCLFCATTFSADACIFYRITGQCSINMIFFCLTQCTSKLGSSWDMNEWMRIRDEPGIWQQIWFNFSEIKGIDLKDLYHYLLIISLLYLKSLSNGAVSERQFIYFENKVNFVRNSVP